MDATLGVGVVSTGVGGVGGTGIYLKGPCSLGKDCQCPLGELRPKYRCSLCGDQLHSVMQGCSSVYDTSGGSSGKGGGGGGGAVGTGEPLGSRVMCRLGYGCNTGKERTANSIVPAEPDFLTRVKTHLTSVPVQSQPRPPSGNRNGVGNNDDTHQGNGDRGGGGDHQNDREDEQKQQDNSSGVAVGVDVGVDDGQGAGDAGEDANAATGGGGAANPTGMDEAVGDGGGGGAGGGIRVRAPVKAETPAPIAVGAAPPAVACFRPGHQQHHPAFAGADPALAAALVAAGGDMVVATSDGNTPGRPKRPRIKTTGGKKRGIKVGMKINVRKTQADWHAACELYRRLEREAAVAGQKKRWTQSSFLKSDVSGELFSGSLSEQQSFGRMLKQYDTGKLLPSNKKRRRERKYYEIEKKLMEYIERRAQAYQRGEKIGLSWNILQKKSLQFADVLGYSDFQASPGWLSDTLRHHGLHGITLGTGTGEDVGAENGNGENNGGSTEEDDFEETLLEQFQRPPPAAPTGGISVSPPPARAAAAAAAAAAREPPPPPPKASVVEVMAAPTFLQAEEAIFRLRQYAESVHLGPEAVHLLDRFAHEVRGHFFSQNSTTGATIGGFGAALGGRNSL